MKPFGRRNPAIGIFSCNRYLLAALPMAPMLYTFCIPDYIYYIQVILTWFGKKLPALVISANMAWARILPKRIQSTREGIPNWWPQSNFVAIISRNVQIVTWIKWIQSRTSSHMLVMMMTEMKMNVSAKGSQMYCFDNSSLFSWSGAPFFKEGMAKYKHICEQQRAPRRPHSCLMVKSSTLFINRKYEFDTL